MWTTPNDDELDKMDESARNKIKELGGQTEPEEKVTQEQEDRLRDKILNAYTTRLQKKLVKKSNIISSQAFGMKTISSSTLGTVMIGGNVTSGTWTSVGGGGAVGIDSATITVTKQQHAEGICQESYDKGYEDGIKAAKDKYKRP